MQQTKKDKKHIQTSNSWINYSGSVHNHDNHLLVFTKSVDCNFRAFWLAPVTRNIRGYSLFWDGIQNGFSFRDSFKRWILAVNEAAAPTNTKKETKFGLSVFTGGKEKIVLLNLQQNHKKWSRNTINWNDKKILTKWHLLFTKSSFLILSSWFGKYQNHYPSQGRFIAPAIYRDAPRLPPLFTSPSGDSCILSDIGFSFQWPKPFRILFWDTWFYVNSQTISLTVNLISKSTVGVGCL